MESNNKLEKSLHKIRSRCVSLKGATELFQGYSAQKQREMLVFMKEAAQDILKCLSELEKEK